VQLAPRFERRFLHGVVRFVRVLKDREGGPVAGFEVRADQGVEAHAVCCGPTHCQIAQINLINKDAREAGLVSGGVICCTPPTLTLAPKGRGKTHYL
jgi:hypothetical protein